MHIVRTLLADGRIDFHGTYFDLENCQCCTRAAHYHGEGRGGCRFDGSDAGITCRVQAWNAWYTWFDNSVEGYRPMRDAVDAACVAAGRDPAEVERTLALLVGFPGGMGRSIGNLKAPDVTPLPSDPATLAATLRAFEAEGVAHVQLVLDPINAETIVGLAPMLKELRA